MRHGRRGRGDGPTDRMLLVSGSACARASASVTSGVNPRRQRAAGNRRPASASKANAVTAATISGTDTNANRRDRSCLPMPYPAPSALFYHDL
jgi:hypothetical protein